MIVAKIDALLQKVNADPDENSCLELADLFMEIGFDENAVTWFTKTLEMVQREDERTWYCMFKIAQCKIKQKQRPEIVTESILNAFDNRPWRMEPIYYLMVYLRGAMLSTTAYYIGKCLGMLSSYPSHDKIGIEDQVYSWKFFDEFASNANLSGHKEEARAWWNKALKGCPEDQKQRIENLIK